MNRITFIIALVSVITTMTVPHHTSGQIPEGWEIVEITNDPSILDARVDMNDRGQVVFNRRTGAGDSTFEIFLYDRDQLIQITDDDIGDGGPAINKLGEIAWLRDLHGDGKLSIVKWRDGKIEVISDQPFREEGVDINGAGKMVWQGLLDGTASTSEVFLFDGNSTIQISNDDFSNLVPRINNNDQIIWTRCDFSGSENAIMMYDQGDIRRISNAEAACGRADLNDSNQVVWVDAQFRLQLWENGSITQISPSVSGSPNINNRGTVVFPRWDSANQIHSIWMFDEAGLTRLTDAPTSRSSNDMNNRGEIAFSWGPLLRDVGVITNPIFRADADFDGDVDLRDYAVLQNCWSASTSFGTACSEADLNADELVESQDIQILVDLIRGPGVNRL